MGLLRTVAFTAVAGSTALSAIPAQSQAPQPTPDVAFVTNNGQVTVNVGAVPADRFVEALAGRTGKKLVVHARLADEIIYMNKIPLAEAERRLADVVYGTWVLDAKTGITSLVRTPGNVKQFQNDRAAENKRILADSNGRVKSAAKDNNNVVRVDGTDAQSSAHAALRTIVQTLKDDLANLPDGRTVYANRPNRQQKPMNVPKALADYAKSKNAGLNLNTDKVLLVCNKEAGEYQLSLQFIRQNTIQPVVIREFFYSSRNLKQAASFSNISVVFKDSFDKSWHPIAKAIQNQPQRPAQQSFNFSDEQRRMIDADPLGLVAYMLKTMLPNQQVAANLSDDSLTGAHEALSMRRSKLDDLVENIFSHWGRSRVERIDDVVMIRPAELAPRVNLGAWKTFLADSRKSQSITWDDWRALVSSGGINDASPRKKRDFDYGHTRALLGGVPAYLLCHLNEDMVRLVMALSPAERNQLQNGGTVSIQMNQSGTAAPLARLLYQPHVTEDHILANVATASGKKDMYVKIEPTEVFAGLGRVNINFRQNTIPLARDIADKQPCMMDYKMPDNIPNSVSKFQPYAQTYHALTIGLELLGVEIAMGGGLATIKPNGGPISLQELRRKQGGAAPAPQPAGPLHP